MYSAAQPWADIVLSAEPRLSLMADTGKEILINGTGWCTTSTVPSYFDRLKLPGDGLLERALK